MLVKLQILEKDNTSFAQRISVLERTKGINSGCPEADRINEMGKVQLNLNQIIDKMLTRIVRAENDLKQFKREGGQNFQTSDPRTATGDYKQEFLPSIQVKTPLTTSRAPSVTKFNTLESMSQREAKINAIASLRDGRQSSRQSSLSLTAGRNKDNEMFSGSLNRQDFIWNDQRNYV